MVRQQNLALRKPMFREVLTRRLWKLPILRRTMPATPVSVDDYPARASALVQCQPCALPVMHRAICETVKRQVGLLLWVLACSVGVELHAQARILARV